MAGILDLARRKLDGTVYRLVFTSDDPYDYSAVRVGPGATISSGRITFPLDPGVVDWFDENIGEYEQTAELREWLAAFVRAREAVERLSHRKYERVSLPLPYADKLYDYQTVGVKWLVEQKRGILADEPGLGKTIQALAAADLGGCLSVLVITVNSTVQTQWASTIHNWNLGSCTVVTGTRTQRVTLMSQERARFTVIPSSLLSSKDGDVKAFLAQKWDCIIIDEAHQFQGRESLRGQAAAKLKTEYMFLLTGTPIWNKLQSVWNLLHIIDKSRWSSYWLWIDRYFNTWKTPFGTQIGKPRAAMEPALKAEVNRVLLRRELLEVAPDFPVAREHVIELEMPEVMRAEYKAIKEAIAEYQDISLGNRVVQITSRVQAVPLLRAFCNMPMDRVACASVGNPKLLEVTSIVGKARSRGLQTLVFTWHTSYADYLAQQLGSGAVSTHGKKSGESRAQILEDFKAGKYDTLVATISSLGTGVDLPDVSVLVFAECSYVPAEIEQSWRRIYRINSTGTKLIVFLYFKKSVEELIYKSFSKKQAMSDELLSTQILAD